mmetsp:Transcript_63968/g.149945  ORF Transcript_63968/g.149945 Transcript_63968/m.149945 type:complete len:496 (-) Transcript_63968:1056-2543(-)
MTEEFAGAVRKRAGLVKYAPPHLEKLGAHLPLLAHRRLACLRFLCRLCQQPRQCYIIFQGSKAARETRRRCRDDRSRDACRWWRWRRQSLRLGLLLLHLFIQKCADVEDLLGLLLHRHSLFLNFLLLGISERSPCSSCSQAAFAHQLVIVCRSLLEALLRKLPGLLHAQLRFWAVVLLEQGSGFAAKPKSLLQAENLLIQDSQQHPLEPLLHSRPRRLACGSRRRRHFLFLLLPLLVEFSLCRRVRSCFQLHVGSPDCLLDPVHPSLHGFARWEAKFCGTMCIGTLAVPLAFLAGFASRSFPGPSLSAELRSCQPAWEDVKRLSRASSALLDGFRAHAPLERPFHQAHGAEGCQRLSQALQGVLLPVLLFQRSLDALRQLMRLQEESDFHFVVELLLWWWVSPLLPQLDLQILGFFRLRFQDLLHLLTVVDLRRLVDVTVETGALAYLSMMIQLAPTVLVIASKSIQHLLHSEVALKLLHRTLEIASYEVTLCFL